MVNVQQPSDVVAWGDVRSTPVVLALVLALLATMTLAHGLISSVRRRRRELALLKTLGFTRRQISGTVAWQASTIAAVAVVFGVPLGIVVGRWAWGVLVDDLGAVAESVVPWAVLAVGIPVLLARRERGRVRSGPHRGRPPSRRRFAERVMNDLLLHWTHDAKGGTMTRIDTPLELTSLRDDDPPARYRPSGSTLPMRFAALLASRPPCSRPATRTPRRWARVASCCSCVVLAWCIGALVTSVLRPSEPLAALMTLTGGTIALAMLGAAEAANHPTYDATAVVRAVAIAALPAVGMHLVLGLPDGRLGDRVRRRWALVVDALGRRSRSGASRCGPTSRSAGCSALGASPPRSRSPATWRAAAGPAPRPPAPGCSGRRGVRSTAAGDRARRGGARRARRLAEGAPRGGGGRDGAAPALARPRRAPVARGAHRPAARAHHHVRRPRRARRAWWRSSVVAALGRSLDGGERSVLGLSIAGAAIAALLWVPARERLQDYANRRVYGEQHAPDEVIRTFGSRLTRALPLDELLLQLAESLKKTMDLERAEVWTRSGGTLERAVSVPDRGHAELPHRHRGGDGDRARRGVRSGVDPRLAPGPPPPGRSRARPADPRRADHELGRAARA